MFDLFNQIKNQVAPDTSHKKIFDATYNKDVRKFDRNFGGNIKTEPYLSGYTFAKFFIPSTISVRTIIDTSLGQMLNNLLYNVTTEQNEMYNSILESSFVSTTIPSKSIQTITHNGLNGNNWHQPGGTTIDDTISMKFMEFSGTPVTQIIGEWIDLISSSPYNVSRLKNFTKNEYQGKILIWNTSPNGKDIEKQYLFTGVFPTKDPRDLFGHDISSVDKIDVNIDFSFDKMFDSDRLPFQGISELQYNYQSKIRQGLNDLTSISNISKDNALMTDLTPDFVDKYIDFQKNIYNMTEGA